METENLLYFIRYAFDSGRKIREGFEIVEARSLNEAITKLPDSAIDILSVYSEPLWDNELHKETAEEKMASW